MKRLLTAAVAATALLLTGCTGSDAETGRPVTDTPGGGTAANPVVYPVQVGKVTLDKQPTSIVSLSPTATEMLFAVGAGDQVKAVDDQSNYPKEAPRTKLSGFKPNAEAIAKQKPDLVIVSDDLNKIVDQLTKLKIPVYEAPAAKDLADTFREISEIGALTGHQDKAQKVVADITAGLDRARKSVQPRDKPLTYYYELDEKLYTLTSKTFVGSLLAQLGLVNIADKADADGKKGGYPQLSQEALVKADPDIIFLADTKCCDQSADTVKKRKGWSGVSAVEKRQIVALDDDVASRWGPRIVDLFQTVAAMVAKVPA